jgi:hypothetical protein
MKVEDASYDRAILHQQGGAARDVSFSEGAAKKGSPETCDATDTAVIRYLPIRYPPSSSPADEATSPWQTCWALIAATLVWLFNEIVFGLAAYGDAIHPIVPSGLYEASNQIEVPQYQAWLQQRANPQERGAISRCDAYVKVAVVHPDARTSPSPGRRSG